MGVDITGLKGCGRRPLGAYSSRVESWLLGRWHDPWFESRVELDGRMYLLSGGQLWARVNERNGINDG